MQKFIVGLTGPTGSGKSTARKTAESLGYFCIDADKISRKETEKGSPLLPILQKEFGNILNSDGSLNRASLASVAFKSNDTVKKLNSIMLPHILSVIENIIKSSECKFILLDAPTLFEAGADKLCNKTVGVIANKDIRLARIMSRDGITKEAAELRISAGKDDAFYKNNCDLLITNNADQKEFEIKAKELFTKLKSEAV